MTDKNDPDQKIKKEDSKSEPEIIDLQKETLDASQGADKYIDLLEDADGLDEKDEKEEAVPQKTDSKPEPEIIELDEEELDISQGDKEVIELLEDVDELEEDNKKEAVVSQKTDSKPEPEIIELDEETLDAAQEIEEIGEPAHGTADMSQQAEDLIDLEEPIELDDEFGKKDDFDPDLSDDFVDSLGMEIDAKEDVSEDLLETDKVSDAQMEAALERVIKKMFYEKIDGILVEVIEKTVTRELEKLKSILLEDAAGNKK